VAHDSTARNLADRVDALAAALRDAGVSPEQSAGLLAAAARATMSAVLLDAVLEEGSAAGAHVRSGADAATHVIHLAA
jgi:hypothetical protein